MADVKDADDDPSKIADQRKVVALCDFEPSNIDGLFNQKTPLALSTGQVVEIIYDDGSELALGHLEGDAETCGYFPKHYTVPVGQYQAYQKLMRDFENQEQQHGDEDGAAQAGDWSSSSAFWREELREATTPSAPVTQAGHEVDVGAATPAEKTGTEQDLAVAIRQSVNNFLAGDSSSCGDDDCDLEELYNFDAKKMVELAEKGGEINEEELVGSSGLMDSAPVSSPTELPVPTEMPSPTEGIEGTEEVRTQDATETREPTEVVNTSSMEKTLSAPSRLTRSTEPSTLPSSFLDAPVLPRSSAGLLESAPPASPSMLPVPTQRPSPTSPPTEGKVPVPVSAVAFASPSLMSSAPVSPSMLPVPTEMPSSPTATPREATQEADALLKAKAAAAEASQKEAKEIRSVVEELRKFQDDLRAHLRQMEADASNRDKVEEDLRAQLRKMEAVAEDLRAQLRKVEADASNKDKVAEWQTVGPDGWVRCIPCNKVVDDNHNSSGNHIRRLKSWLAHEQRKKTGYAAPALEYLAYVPSIPGDDTSERWLKCLLCGKFVQDDTSHSGTKEKPQGSGKHRKSLTKYVGTAWYQENVINERLKWHPPTQVPYPSSLQTGLPSADAAAEGEEFSC